MHLFPLLLRHCPCFQAYSHGNERGIFDLVRGLYNISLEAEVKCLRNAVLLYVNEFIILLAACTVLCFTALLKDMVVFMADTETVHVHMK